MHDACGAGGPVARSGGGPCKGLGVERLPTGGSILGPDGGAVHCGKGSRHSPTTPPALRLAVLNSDLARAHSTLRLQVQPSTVAYTNWLGFVHRGLEAVGCEHEPHVPG